MKKIVAVCIFVLLFFLSPSAAAQELPGQEIADELTERTPSQARELAEELGVEEISPEQLLTLSPSDFLQLVYRQFRAYVRQPFAGLAVILAGTILSAVLVGFKSAGNGGTLHGAFSSVSSLAVSTVLLSTAVSCIRKVSDSVVDFSDFLNAYVPVFAAAITASGQPTTGGVYSTFMFTVCQIISRVGSNVLVPLLGCYLALSFVSGLSPTLKISAVADAVKKSTNWIFNLLLTVFVGMMSLQSLVATGSDTLAIKTGKYLIGSVVPVVGSAMSDVFLSVQGCMKLMKTCIGGYGILIAVLVFLPVLVETLVWRVAIYLAQLFAEVLDIGSVAGILKSVGAVFTMLLALILTFAMLLIVSTTVMMVLGMG